MASRLSNVAFLPVLLGMAAFNCVCAINCTRGQNGTAYCLASPQADLTLDQCSLILRRTVELART
jgi:hypothetical protein